MKCFTLVFLCAIFTTVNAQVSPEWARRYNGLGSGTDQPKAIVADLAGNVYVTGSSLSGGFGTEEDVTINYNSAGSLHGEHRYAGSGGSSDRAYAIGIDAAGSIYVTGGSLGSTSNYDYLTIKYSTVGDTLWTRRYNGPRNGMDVAYSLAIDDSGYIYITGESEGSTGTHGIFEDYLTIKYSPDGATRWSARYNGPAGDYDRANGIAVDKSGTVFVTGTSDGGSSGSGSPFFDYATLKYNSAGVQQWVRRYNGPGSSDDEANAVKVDAAGNIFITGYSVGTGTADDIATIKYSAAGDTLWTSRYNGPGNNTDQARALALDSLGNSFVTGASYGGSLTGDDFVTIKYDSLGDTAWVRRYNGPATGADAGTAIVLDNLGNVLVTGSSLGLTTSLDYATLEYDQTGAEQWAVRYTNSAAAGSSDEPTGIVVDTSYNVYVCGMSALDYATVKYTPSPTGTGQTSLTRPRNYSLAQNRPNPVNPETTIRFYVPRSEYATLRIFNIRGVEVARPLSQEVLAGAHQIAWNAQGLPGGVYIYSLQAGGFQQTKKLLVLK
jgi:hypothetical protein